MIKEFETLGEVQKIDLEIDAIKSQKKRSAEKDNLDFSRKNLARVQSVLAAKEENLKKQEKAQKKEEGELEMIALKIQKEEKLLYDGTITDSRELSSIERETTYLKKMREQLETKILEKLESNEMLQEEIENLNKEIGKVADDLNSSEEKYQQILIKLEQRLGELKEKRRRYVNNLSSDTMALYEKVRAEKGTLGAVELKNGICQGCHLELPAEDVDKIENSTGVFQCPYCARIIIR